MSSNSNLIEDALTAKLRQSIENINNDCVYVEIDQCLEKALADTLELAIFLQKMISIRQEAKQKADHYTHDRKK